MSALRSKLRRCRELLTRGTPEQAAEAFLAATKTLDRETARGTLHRNAAARRKSRLARRLNALRSKPTA